MSKIAELRPGLLQVKVGLVGSFEAMQRSAVRAPTPSACESDGSHVDKLSRLLGSLRGETAKEDLVSILRMRVLVEMARRHRYVIGPK